MANVNLSLAAIADPTRRQVFERLGAGPLSVGEIAEGLPVSRPAVSQHLKVLKDAGLVERKRNRLYVLTSAYQPVPGEPLLDYGHCILRLDAAG